MSRQADDGYTGATRKMKQGWAWKKLPDFCATKQEGNGRERRLSGVKQNSCIGSSFTPET